MEHGFFHKLSSILWKAVVGITVAFAIYVSFGRFIMSTVGTYGDDILRELNARTPFMLEASRVSGEWHSFTPEIVLTDLRLIFPQSNEPPLELAEGRIAVDVWETLRTLSLQTYSATLEKLMLHGELTSEGKLKIAGFSGGGGDFAKTLETFLLNIERINLSDNQLVLNLPDGSQRIFDLDLSLQREGSVRRIDATLLSAASGTQITVLARGLGNPMKPDEFSGEAFLDVTDSNLEALQSMLTRDLGVQLAGRVNLQSWLTWESGEPSVVARVQGEEITVTGADEAWQLPLEEVFLETSLTQRDDRWTLFASDFELRKDGVSLAVPRMQFDLRGDSLRVRANNLPLAPINALFQGLERAPEKAAEVFEILGPRGELNALQVELADYKKPLEDWELRANFRDLTVESWRGAPGVKADGGYVELENDGGFVIVDSHQFAMEFPTVYEEALRFDDFYGTVYLNWTSTDVTVTSGLMIAQGVEGNVRALFGLNVPLQPSEVGLEMDILVGLEDSHPIHRAKYVPYILNESLRNWLQGAIGEGRIEEGAFLWRGSLLRGATDLRTVQLFFNVADTNLNYYTGWPAVSGVDGTVLIDDTNISVWAEQARLYGSQISYLSAEAWMDANQHIVLEVAAQMSGNAADGLKVINESPLNEIVGAAFSDWQMQGDLDVRLELGLDLTNASAFPQINVEAALANVELLIEPGNLQVDDLAGQLHYSSEKGFETRDLTGTFWGRPLTALARQRPAGPDGSIAYTPASSVTEVLLSADVAMQDIRDWLDLRIISLADGVTRADVQVEVVPGEVPRFTLQTDLAGVSLDLPEPWLKPAEEVWPATLTMPLAGEEQLLRMDLDGEVFVDVLLRNVTLAGVALGFQEPLSSVEAGKVNIGGHASLVDDVQWSRFLDDYVYEQAVTSPAAVTDPNVPAQVTEPGTDAPPGPEVQDGNQELALSIDSLRADTLLLFGQGFRDVVFSIEERGEDLHLFAEADWFRGQLLLNEDYSEGSAELEHLDLEGLKQLDFDSFESEGVTSLALDIAIRELSYGGESLGELYFDVQRSDETLRADNIIGDIAGLRITEEKPANILWTLDEEAGSTDFRGVVEFDDLGQTLERLSYQNVIETSDGQFDLALDWPGGPQDFSLDVLNGSVRLQTGQGRFLNTPSGASGTLRVVGILNLADIVQRLSLDFSDMFVSGIPFHDTSGEIFFHGGTLEVAGFDVKGRSSGFQFSGVSDLAAETIDGELIATLPVANNLPWVAALAAGLPVAAGVFVVSKVFEKQVNRFSSAVYKITGPLEDPEVSFDRIFDTSTSAPKVILPPDPNAAAAEVGSLAQDPNTQTAVGTVISDPNGVMEGATTDQNVPAAPEPNAPD